MTTLLKQFVLFAVLVSMISACQFLPKQSARLPTELAALEKMDHWAIDGKLSVSNGTEAISAFFDWQQIGSKMKLNMAGPLGIGRMSIIGDVNGEFWLSSAKTGSVISPSGSKLAQDYLGIAVPVDSLPIWLKGIPDTSIKYSFKPDIENQTTTIKQAGWLIKLSRYQQHGEVLLPAKLEAAKGDIKVKVIIKSWDINEV